MREIKSYNRQLIHLECAGNILLEETGYSDAPWTIDTCEDHLGQERLHIRYRLADCKYSMSIKSLRELVERSRKEG